MIMENNKQKNWQQKTEQNKNKNNLQPKVVNKPTKKSSSKNLDIQKVNVSSTTKDM
jgi:hypothetical protein